jgi:phospholipase D1/2
VRIGSANLANRSMGLDTECDLTIAAHGRSDVSEAIAKLRCQLLAEHLGFEPQVVHATIEQKGNIRDSIEALPRSDRTLKPLIESTQVSDRVLNMVSVADPEKPVALSDLTKIFNSDVQVQRSGPSWGKIVVIVTVLASLTALWNLTPLAEVLEANRVTQWAREVGSRWWAPLVTMFAYTPAAVTMFPRPLITLFAVVAFGPWLGFVYAMLGIELSAWFTYVAGKRLDRDTVRRVAGAKLNDIVEVLRKRGLIAMTALRLVPLAPFAVEGVVAGAVRIKLWHFMLGTAIGMLPGTLASTIFGDQLQAAMHDPAQVNYWIIGAALALLATATFLVRRWLVNSSKVATPGEVRGARAA